VYSTRKSPSQLDSYAAELSRWLPYYYTLYNVKRAEDCTTLDTKRPVSECPDVAAM
jgi:hypothetical protein